LVPREELGFWENRIMNACMTGLTRTDQGRLVELEAVIDAGLPTFQSVGRALLEIRDKKLYRVSHPTFEDYCQSRWGFCARTAYRLIAGEVSHNLRQDVTNPETPATANGEASMPGASQRIAELLAKGLEGMEDLSAEEQLEVVQASESQIEGNHAAAFRQGGQEGGLRQQVERLLVRWRKKLAGRAALLAALDVLAEAVAKETW
jgi:hypothetical protein